MLDYCATGPKPCQKNLGIPRIHMPQINSALDFKLLKGIVRKLGLKSKIKDLNVKKELFDAFEFYLRMVFYC